ncbi:hypothetical protein CH359_00660 [Leptospira meyeri]|nr:hypothetical protein CH359_00660 [Leptospira meyeri]PJZ98239.1 hypothetical protein CH358_04715 [Leptospira meyeri]PKA12027.1 hypothetical protein CH372_11525 [Leptospira meyeri]PKA23462.1 hypothetical protein CH381_25675 [Leptospira sp. mixed culture ATI2-C-A1]
MAINIQVFSFKFWNKQRTLRHRSQWKSFANAKIGTESGIAYSFKFCDWMELRGAREKKYQFFLV